MCMGISSNTGELPLTTIIKNHTHDYNSSNTARTPPCSLPDEEIQRFLAENPKPPKKIPPQFNRSWPGHSAAFVAKVDARVLEVLRARGYPGPLKVSDTMWKWVCN